MSVSSLELELKRVIKEMADLQGMEVGEVKVSVHITVNRKLGLKVRRRAGSERVRKPEQWQQIMALNWNPSYKAMLERIRAGDSLLTEEMIDGYSQSITSVMMTINREFRDLELPYIMSAKGVGTTKAGPYALYVRADLVDRWRLRVSA
jgi:hypothetical protein